MRIKFLAPALSGAVVVLGLVVGSHQAQGADFPAAQATVSATANADATTTPEATASSALPNVFVIVMENHDWSAIHNNPSAPYINNTLLMIGAHAEQYFNPPHLHPSEPNYLWMEAGTNFGITNDGWPGTNHLNTTAHLTHLLDAAGISWKAYQEGITGKDCPLETEGRYAPKHNPMVYFDDVTDTNNPKSSYCIAHMRPYTELSADLTNDAAVHYNFIIPDLCSDMHDSAGCKTPDSVKNGDTWLSAEVPKILASHAYQQNGVIFITWDESEGGEVPIGMIVLSVNAKAGYMNSVHYTHSSLLRTVQEIFNVSPFLGDAANATDLADMFTLLP